MTGSKCNLKYTITVNEDILNMKTPNANKKTPPKTTMSKESITDKNEINRFKQVSKGDLALTQKEFGKVIALNSVKKTSNSNGNLLTSSSNLNPSLNPKIISNTKLSKEEKLRHDDISKNKVDINVKLEPKRVSLYNSRNQVTPSYKSISGETKIHSDIRRTNKETLNNKGSVDSKKESNYKNISSNETIQKVTLSLYIDNYSQNKFRSS